MKKRTALRSRLALVALLSAGLVLPACSQLQADRFRSADEHYSAPSRSQSPVTDGDESRQNMLLAVQDFLARTENYELADPTRATPPAVTPTGSPNAGTPVAASSTQIEQRGRESLDAPGADDRPMANTHVTLSDTANRNPPLAVPRIESVSVRAVNVRPIASPAGYSEPTVPPANHPLEVQGDDAAISTDQFLHRLETEAADAPDVDSEWRVRLVRLALNRDDETAGPSSALPQAARVTLEAFIHLGREIRRLMRDPLSTGEEALLRLDDLRRVVAHAADPVISGVALCRKVVTFGVYDDMPAEDFTAGILTQTIVYSEIRNLQSEVTEDGQYRTLLETRIEVLSEGGDSVWHHEEPEIIDQCRRRRTDFFIAQRIALPPTLAPGEYVLKVLVVDKLAGKADEALHRFTLHPAATRTAGR